jgi:hypothetical protein
VTIPGRQEDAVANPLQERLAEVLLDRISRDNFPSSTYMDIFESIAPRRLLAVYILLLLDRIENEMNPSIPMMQRVQKLIGEF